MKRKLAAVLLVCFIILLWPALPASAAEIVASGRSGDLTWTLDDTGLLTITGEGPMDDFLNSYSENEWGGYSWGSSPPRWRQNGLDEEINALVIGEGVTTVGSAAFSDCSNLKSLSLPQSLTQIGDFAFDDCSSLSSVAFPEGLIRIGVRAFNSCGSLTELSFPESLTQIGNHAFSWCSDLTDITFSGNQVKLGRDVFSDCGRITSAFIPGDISDSEPAVSSNARRNNYDVRADTVRSYLYRDGNNLIRFENAGGRLLAETYSPEFRLLGSRYLDSDLGDLWGGFFPGEKYNFLILGHQNPEENEETQVVHVRKYSKAWELLGEAGLYGANTTLPFRAASLRCAEYNGLLYIHTGHQMYQSEDGLRHQANLTFCLRESDMEITDARYGVSNISTGYVSHSFNQFILVDEAQNLVTLDHGDAYPRSAVLQRYLQKAGEQLSPPNNFWHSTEAVDILQFPGQTGDNTTGASLGGLAETSSGYITACSYNGTGDSAPVRNIFLSHTPKDDFTEDATTVRQITSYEAGGSLSGGTPVLAPLGPEGGYVLWSLRDAEGSDTLCYARYAADGSVGEVQTGKGTLSDCQPIALDGKVIWYVTDNSAPLFYTLDESGLTVRHAVASFSDVADWDYFAPAVTWAAGHEPLITNGMGDGSFGAYSTVTRAQAVTFLWRAFGEPETGTNASPFDDVTDPEAYYYRAVLWAKEQGVTTGQTPEHFGVGDTLTYSQFLTFLCRASGFDVSGADWAEKALGWAEEQGLTEGLEISSKGNCPRRNVVYFLWQLLA